MPRKDDWVDNLKALDGLTRADVAKLPEAEREARRDRLAATAGVVGYSGFAKITGLSPAYVRTLRNHFLNNGVGGQHYEPWDMTPAPDPEVNSGDIRTPGDGRVSRGDSPKWTYATVLAWAARWRRIDVDYVPNRHGRASGVPAPAQVDA